VARKTSILRADYVIFHRPNLPLAVPFCFANNSDGFLFCDATLSFAGGLHKEPNINGLIIKKMVMPVPPLAEQARIVTRVTVRLCADLRQCLAER